MTQPILEVGTEPRREDTLYIAWTRYQRRPISMAKIFGYRLHFLPAIGVRSGILKGLFSYPAQAARTAVLVATSRPRVLWLQIPPSFLLHLAWLARILSGGRLFLIADLHNSALSNFWMAVPLTRLILNSFDILLVHNEPTRQTAIKLGLKGRNLLVLEDHLPDIAPTAPVHLEGTRCRFVVPCSFHSDEPIANVIEAARQAPEFDFFLTGDRLRAEKLGYLASTPENVVFTGFLPIADYERLLVQSTAVLCLTTRDGIQLSAASEAVSAEKPMIISDTPLLRTLFSTGLFVDNSPQAIWEACHAVAHNYSSYANATRLLRDDVQRSKRWQEQANRVKSLLPSEA